MNKNILKFLLFIFTIFSSSSIAIARTIKFTNISGRPITFQKRDIEKKETKVLAILKGETRTLDIGDEEVVQLYITQ